MNIWERFKIAVAAFRRVGGVEIPLGNGAFGRSSEETLAGNLKTALTKYQTINPVIDFELLKLIKKYHIYNPDVSQFVSNITNLANNGHSIAVDAQSESTATAALSRLNESASRLYKNSAGVDGLINAYLSQIAWSGALSSEDVIDLRARRVDQVALVPVESIRFKYDEEILQYVPYQRTNNFSRNQSELGLIRLHPETYKYFALSTVENNPYAKPPATAAIEAILNGQEPMMKNIQYIAQKCGLLGLLTMSVVPPPRKPNETEAEFQSRAKSYLSAISKAVEGQLSKGFLAAFRDQKIEHTNLSAGANGVYDLNRMSEEQVMSGLAMQPAFFGRTDSTTETYADVVYNLLLAQISNIRRLPKRRMEQTYRLDLRLGGIDVDGVSLTFNKPFSRNNKQNAETEEIQIRNVIAKVEKGLITPDEGAQELGYESWSDPELINSDVTLAQALSAIREQKNIKSFQFIYSKQNQKYSFVSPVIQVLPSNLEKQELPGNVLQLKKKTLQQRVSN